MAGRLETASNVATMLLACCAIALTTGRYFRTPQPRSPQHPSANYQVGQDLSKVIPQVLSTSNSTLIVAIQKKCPYCEMSMPFYAKIIEERNRRDASLKVAFVAPAADTDLGAYLSSKGVAPDSITLLPPDTALQVSVTPTILLLDKAGKLLSSVAGVLREEDQNEFLTTLFGPRS